MSSPHRQNNFDLIRLLAAAQVVIAHAIGHTELLHQLSPWGRRAFDALMLLPGVPVFFVISGFLIMRSFERNPADLKGYFWRRSLRIFPGLWACLVVTLAALAACGFLPTDFIFSKTFAAWLSGQISFFQFYNPEQFRGFGIGVANGALWTITVELQFYAFIPVFHFLTRKPRAFLTPAIFLVSFATFCAVDDKVNGPGGFTGAPLAFKLLHVTLIPHLWMFLLGTAIHRRHETLRPWLEGKFLWYLTTYVLFVTTLQTLVDSRSLPFYLGYLPSRMILAMGTIAAAYSARSLSNRLLRGTDLSYGIYLYHSVVINLFVQFGWMASPTAVIPVFIVSTAAALVSWHAIEKPALAWKSLSSGLIWMRRPAVPAAKP